MLSWSTTITTRSPFSQNQPVYMELQSNIASLVFMSQHMDVLVPALGHGSPSAQTPTAKHFAYASSQAPTAHPPEPLGHATWRLLPEAARRCIREALQTLKCAYKDHRASTGCKRGFGIVSHANWALDVRESSGYDVVERDLTVHS